MIKQIMKEEGAICAKNVTLMKIVMRTSLVLKKETMMIATGLNTCD